MKRRTFLGKAAGLVATMTALSGMGARLAAGDTSKSAAKGLGDDHGLGEALAQAAMLLRERHGQKPEVRVLLPQLGAVALRLLHVAVALAELAVGIAQQPFQAVLQLALLVVEIEIHGSAFEQW